MKRYRFSALSAAVLAAALSAPVFAQGLDDATASGIAKLGIQTPDVATMSTEQVAQIKNVLGSDEAPELKKMRIERILGGEATATGRLGVAQLQDSVAANLATLGIDAEVVATLTLSQLGQIENVMATSESPESKKAQVERIVAD